MNVILCRCTILPATLSLAILLFSAWLQNSFGFVHLSKNAAIGYFGCRCRSHIRPKFHDGELQRPASQSWTQQQLDRSSDHENIDLTIVDGPFHSSLLDGYWGARPLLVRNAFSGVESWPSWDEIMKLCCGQQEDHPFSGENARLFRHIPGKLDSFQLDLGPFDLDKVNQTLQSTNKKTKCTLILNDVDRYIPALDDWINANFHFLPRWRRDDAQVSLATVGGGIGPHVDNYDVFLIQTSGQRLWHVNTISKMTVSEERTKLIPGIPVSVLNIVHGMNATSNFTELLLNKGDMLYLPPRVVHWGIGCTNDCMTMSVGARAPAASDLMVRIAEFLQQGSLQRAALQRYTDDLMSAERCTDSKHNEPHSLSMPVKESMKELVRNCFHDLLNDDLAWDHIVGNVVTEPIRHCDTFPIPYEGENDDYKKIWGESAKYLLQRVKQLGTTAILKRVSGIAFASSRITTGNEQNDRITVNRLYANGECYELLNNQYASSIFRQIEIGQPIDGALLAEIVSSDPMTETLEALIEEGCLRAYLLVSEEVAGIVQ
jgi:50S ribosomal protein L16 3-hydroxylase